MLSIEEANDLCDRVRLISNENILTSYLYFRVDDEGKYRNEFSYFKLCVEECISSKMPH